MRQKRRSLVADRRAASEVVNFPVRMNRGATRDARAIQRAFSLHRKFGTLDHGRSNSQPKGRTDFYGLQRGKSRYRQGAARSSKSARTGASTHQRDCAVRTGMSSQNRELRRWISSSRFATTRQNEVCPVWPGQPMTAHWGVADPTEVKGSSQQIERAFREAYLTLDRRIGLFLCLPIASLDKLAIQTQIDRIGSQ